MKYLKVYKTKWVEFYTNKASEIKASGVPVDPMISTYNTGFQSNFWIRIPEWVKMAITDWEETGGMGGMTLGEYLALIKG